MAHFEVNPSATWATAAGERLLRRVAAGHAGNPRPALTALAVHGPGTLTEPALRTALHSSGA
ncbi:hypothetical protein [Streptomyces halobius]|uniref:Uncharacterized protein n=1 Tax=Streptomyces halobius TaxID=2879846 RepID=A0ABY4M6U6_9ACTN|nr:hypothetical protein [Streptomyces halobius]UQA92549.1 hypothetical protein K9S39_12600 [Streptomyces halobius]